MLQLTHAKNAGLMLIVAGVAERVGLVREVWWKVRPVFRRFGRDRRGAAAVEFALVANAFILLVFLMLEASWMMTVEMAVNEAGQAAARLGSLGKLQATYSNNTDLTAAIKAAMVNYGAGVLNTSYLTVTMQSYGTAYNLVNNVTPTSGAGSSRQLVQYMATYSQPLLTPLASAILGGRTSFSHSVNIVVQNEPF